MLDLFLTGLLFTIPLIVSGILHMVAVRTNVLPALKRPISQPIFGPNKTWRGVVLMPIFTILGVFLARLTEPAFGSHLIAFLGPSRAGESVASGVVLGAVLGLAYVLAELPNSLMKRRLGIAPGMTPERGRVLFVLVDQADSAIGCAIAYLALLRIPILLVLLLCVLGPGVHLAVNLLLFLLGLRKRPV